MSPLAGWRLDAAYNNSVKILQELLDARSLASHFACAFVNPSRIRPFQLSQVQTSRIMMHAINSRKIKLLSVGGKGKENTTGDTRSSSQLIVGNKPANY